MTKTYTVAIRGRAVQFESSFDDLASAYHALAGSGKLSDFADNLLAAARARRLSPVQLAWVHKLATDAASDAAPRFAAPDLDLSEIIAMFDAAHEAGKKWPSIKLSERFDEGIVEARLTIKRVGSRSQKYEGCGRISTATGEYAGMILRDGTVATSFHFGDVEDLLRELAQDPVQVLAQNGIATSQCCYCARALTTRESREVGYGPICAAKYGLPWGTTNAVDAASEEASEIPTADDIIEDDAEKLLDERDSGGPAASGYTGSNYSRWRSRNTHRIRHD